MCGQCLERIKKNKKKTEKKNLKILSSTQKVMYYTPQLFVCRNYVPPFFFFFFCGTYLRSRSTWSHLVPPEPLNFNTVPRKRLKINESATQLTEH